MTSTGRLSSSNPNLQAVTKYQLSHDTEGFNVRNAFIATAPPPPPPAAAAAPRTAHGTVLLSADYSQVELRLLAHFSGDAGLLRQLQLAGPRGDVFRMIAHTWLGAPSIDDVSDRDREKAKRIVYGLIYGLSAYGLAQQLGCTVSQAQVCSSHSNLSSHRPTLTPLPPPPQTTRLISLSF
jgi:DNA polymerase I-like protein with 3'-5' exonuclease and polymerase domains